ncbi:Crp/Fnr family transcriptional regulator [Stutzerimonas stutzeri]|uniref:Crp/Fnr family transcriptional regulator n=1 Tax=Stutzerimonas stutzeri TaxID=316 RepID=UPI0005F0EC3A|nr:Crp/Fnr family transcriptional regulator [Stutzerimonas stutzeri]KJS26802.1 MAG: Crp/Fnr family transcriptional regulator [Pseudomonas sp. BRH_c35]PNG12506.1 Crp/Fnr family transcriptional regulator [Stutzerimonas stutzeri]
MAFTPQHNHLLAALSEATQERLFRLMESVVLPQGKTIYEAGEIISHVYFPVDSIISLLHVMGNGDTAEISVIGNEGLAGISLFMGVESTISRAVVQSAGQAYRMQGKLLQEELSHHGELQMLILRYAHTLIIQISNTSLCYRYHSVPQQLCRYLLLSLDRLPGNRLAMTQKQIADNLGVRREGITEAAGTLRRLGVIEYCRGHITVLNRNMLEQLSCECYAKVKQETDRLMPGYRLALAEG